MKVLTQTEIKQIRGATSARDFAKLGSVMPLILKDMRHIVNLELREEASKITKLLELETPQNMNEKENEIAMTLEDHEEDLDGCYKASLRMEKGIRALEGEVSIHRENLRTVTYELHKIEKLVLQIADKLSKKKYD